MYFIYSGSNNQYASAAVSKRDGSNTSIEYLYLGRVIDKDKGIYKSKDRGMLPSMLQPGHLETFRTVIFHRLSKTVERKSVFL